MLLLGVFADNPLPYPFGPFEEAADARRAARLERTYAGEGGTALALQQTCAGSNMSLHVPDLVARNFLIAHADRTYPRLLDRLARSGAGDDEWECAPHIEGLMMAGACYGYEISGGDSELEAHPPALARRARARRALVRALDGGGRRGEAAIKILDEMGWNICPGSQDAMRAATPNLVKWIGVPTPPLVIPTGYEDDPGWARALRVLTYEGVDRAVAEAPVRAFLAHDETVGLAALALARMGADATAALPRLRRLLDAVPPKKTLEPAPEVRRMDAVLDALQAIGKPAAVSLPNLAALAAHIETPGCRTFGRDRFVGLVRAIVTPATAKTAIDILTPMLRCQGDNIIVAQALAELGPAAREAVLSSLRDEGRTIAERLAAAHALERPEHAPLGAADRRLLQLLDAKLKTHKQHVGLNLSPRDFSDAAAEIMVCRAEAHLDDLPAPKSKVSWAFASCISNYLCGPDRGTYFQTIQRCCGRDWNKAGDYCRDLRDPAPDAGSHSGPTH
jgi:hypothetical protein